MRSEITPEREESREELALRATLQMYAGEAVDADAAWGAVAPRLTSLRRNGVVQRRRRGPLAGASRGILIAAAVVALVVALAGAGVGAAYWGGIFGGPKARLIGDQKLYTTIGQSQTIDGVTVSADKAYADPGNTYIALSVTMPYALASRYRNVIANHVTIADTTGNEAQGLNMYCDPLWHDPSFRQDGVEHCLMDAGPLQPAAGATALNLSVEIGELWLFPVNGAEREIHPGSWRFQFTLPYHQQSLGPGGPYAAPGVATPSDQGTKKP
jgi:hypothetical protein